MQVTFSILGEPRGKQRPRMTKAGHTYTPSETVNYETLVKWEYRSQCHGYKFPDDTALSANIFAYYQIPKSASKKRQQAMARNLMRPLKKTDCDNLMKIILDSLNGIAYHDDVQIVDCQVHKFYSFDPKVIVELSEAETEDDRNAGI